MTPARRARHPPTEIHANTQSASRPTFSKVVLARKHPGAFVFMNEIIKNKIERPENKWTEDLLWQAERAADLGRRLCHCEGKYHTLWSALRASGFLGSLHSEEDSLAAALSPIVRNGRRFLIGGSADPATLCAVGRISKNDEPDITIVDRCRAPLALINEFAEKQDISCKTIHANLLEFDVEDKWDVIFLNYTLSFIEPNSRRTFFGRLASLLPTGGHLVCLAKTGIRAERGRRDDLISAWLKQARKALLKSGLEKYFEPFELEAAIKQYAEERTTRRFNIISSEEIKELLLGEGLNVSSVNATRRKWVLDGISGDKADAESSVIVIAIKNA